MTTFLLDVSVLIALVDEAHGSHKMVQKWFRGLDGKAWATCAVTEAGFVRIISNAGYSAPPVDVQEALELLSVLTRLAGHRFWACDVSLAEAVAPFRDRLFGHKQVTDGYLLGLAINKKGILATLDRGIEALAGSEFGHYVAVLR